MVDSAPISQVTKGCSDFNNRDFPSTFEEQQRAKLMPVLFFTHWRLPNITDCPVFGKCDRQSKHPRHCCR